MVEDNTLSWTPAGDEMAWDIHFDLLSAGFHPELTLPTLTVTEPVLDLATLNLSPGQTYGFRVRANWFGLARFTRVKSSKVSDVKF